MKTLTKETESLQQASHNILDAAIKAGAQDVEVCANFEQRNKITLEKQDYHLASSDHGFHLGLRVTKGSQQGFASTNSLDLSDLKETAKLAVKICDLAPENEHQVILPAANISKDAPNLSIDEQFLKISMGTQQDWTELLVKEATKDERFRLSDGAMEISANSFLILNSKGTQKVERDALASWTLMGMGIEGENITSFDYFSQMQRKVSDTPQAIVKSVEKFSEKVIASLKSGPAESYKGIVVFSPRAVRDIFLSGLVYHLNGRNVVDQTSRWTQDSLGKKQLSDKISLTDNPWLTDRMGFATFDREGNPTHPHTLIDEGKINLFTLDNYAAHALGRESTGHARGGPLAPPSVGTHSLCLAKGETPFFHMMKQVTDSQENFLLVNRFSGRTDPITGDFSGVAKGADWWHRGERTYCVKETLISGNIFEGFNQGLIGFSQETEIIDAGTEAPSAIVDGVSVTTN